MTIGLSVNKKMQESQSEIFINVRERFQSKNMIVCNFG